MSTTETLITYEDLLKRISNTENHLLLGNGFNNVLGVGTSYKDIFEKMKKEYSDYQKLEEQFNEKHQDIEALIGMLTQDIPENNKEFLSVYINNKIKLDFMKAANTIVQSKIKNICNNKNEGIYILFSHFTNYFTLNYDPFLYLLLMKFKKPPDDTTKKNNSQMNALGFTDTINSQYASLKDNEQDLYNVIKKARDDGTFSVKVNTEISETQLSQANKTDFISAVKKFLKQNNHYYKGTEIEKVVNHIWNEEQNNEGQLKADDGYYRLNAIEKEFVYKYSENQNIFFIHGAFHIKEKENIIYKIKQTSEKPLYKRIEEAINKEEEIICVFRHDDKLNEINKNKYLKEAYKKLTTLEGSLVIFGCSMSENDSHVFNQIEESNIDTVYISSIATKESDTTKQEKIIKQDYEKAKKYFTKKNIVLFDARNISYQNSPPIQ